MYKEKWYLDTWFICLLFAAWPFVLPPFVGLVFLLMQIKENKTFTDQMKLIGSLNQSISQKRDELNKFNNEMEAKKALSLKEYDEVLKTLNIEKDREEKKFKRSIESLRQEENLLNSSIIVSHFNFSDYSSLASEQCKNNLTMLKTEQQELIKSNQAISIHSSGSKKEINDNIKQILRCFNSECDNIILNLSVKNIDSMRNKIARSFESLNKIFNIDGIQMDKQLLDFKLKELDLVYTFELKKEQEYNLQKAIREQMIEEEKVRKEIEHEKAKIEKDQMQFTNEVNKLIKYLQKTDNSVEKQLYIDKIKELEEKLKELEQEKETVLEREANAKAGFVYIISNIGSFGEDIYKIGMTRRLEPMDRIKELSSASVPFEFDVHAMIFSSDAPNLETSLHKHFENESLNKINLRKEFFKVSLDDIESYVLNNYNNTVQFTKIPLAKEFRQTLEMNKVS